MDGDAARPGMEDLLAHARFVRGLARSLLRDGHLAEDLEQEAWVAAMERPPGRGVRGWFRAVARNLAAKALRSRERRGRREREAARPEGVPGPADLAARESALREVTEAVLALDPLHREVVVLRFYEDLPPREIAARLGIPVNTVRSRLSRALAELRERLDRRHGGRREGWALAVAGFAGGGPGIAIPGEGAGAGAVAGAGIAAGVAMGAGAKIAAGGALLLLLGGTWWIAREGAEGPGAAPPVQGAGGGPRREGPAASAPGPASPSPPGDPPPPPAAGPAKAAPGMTVVGEVVDAEGKRVPGAAVTLGIPDPVSGVLEESPATADAEGAFRLEVPSTEFLLRADAEGFLGGPLTSVRGAAGETRSVTLVLPARTAVLEGRVLDPSGNPLPRVVVRTFPPQSLFAPGRREGPEAVTDALGRFRIEEVPAGVRVTLLAQDLPRAFAPWTGSALLEAGATREIEVRLAAGAVLSGTVRGADGAPAAGVSVKVVGYRGVAGLGTRTDAEGRFRLHGLAPEPTDVTADGGPTGRASGKVELRAGEETGWEGVLGTGAVIRGRIRDAAGGPLAGWAVMVRPDASPFGRTGDVLTDGEGAFAVPGLEDAAYRVLVSAKPGELAVLDLRAVRPGPEGLDLSVPADAMPSARIEGTLLAADGAPASDAILSLVPADAGETWWAAGSCALDRDTGRFSGGPFPPGAYRVSAWSEVLGTRDLGDRDLRPGRTLDLGRVVLPAPGSLALAFVLDAGSREALARFHLEAGRPDGTWIPGPRFQEARGSRTIPLAPGTWRLSVHGNGTRGLRREFEVRPGEAVRQEIRIEPAPMRWLRLVGAPGATLPQFVRVRAFDAGGVLQHEANVGRGDRTDHVLAWTFLVPGTYEVEIAPDRGETTRAPLEVGETTATRMEEPLEIRLR